MTYVITPNNRTLYRAELDAMFKMRARVVAELGWDVPGAIEGYDRDQFDREDTVYLLVMNDARDDVLACTRLNPTTGPHMMSEVFAHYCDLKPFPRDPGIWECSRYMIDRSRCSSKDEQTKARKHLGLGLTEYCLSHGIRAISWLTHEYMYNLTQRVYDTRPLGLPKYEASDGANYIAAVSDINMEGWHRQMANLPPTQPHATLLTHTLLPQKVRTQHAEAA